MAATTSIAADEETIKGVCEGAIISNAAPYKGGLGPHPIFIVSSSFSDQKGWNEQMPNSWVPTSLETLQRPIR